MLILFKKAQVVLTAETLELKFTPTEVSCCNPKIPIPHIALFNRSELIFSLDKHRCMCIYKYA